MKLQFPLGDFEVPLPHPSSRTPYKAFVTIDTAKIAHLINKAAMKKHRQTTLQHKAIIIEVSPQ